MACSVQALAMWAEWLSSAEIYGLDIHDFSAFQHDRCHTFKLDQSDQTALQAFAAEHGPFDVIIDDGAHLSDAQQVSFFMLWSALKPGGFYFIEDLHFHPPTEPEDAVKTKALFHGYLVVTVSNRRMWLDAWRRSQRSSSLIPKARTATHSRWRMPCWRFRRPAKGALFRKGQRFALWQRHIGDI